MIAAFSSKIAIILHKHNKERFIDVEIYQFGLELILSTVINFIVMLIVSLLLGCTKEILVYIVFFSALRTFAGGYHANTHLKCLIEYALIAFISVYFIQLISINRFYYTLVIIACIISLILVFCYAPVDSVNKPFNESEQNLFRIRSRQIVSIQMVLIIISAIFFNTFMSCVLSGACGMLVESITLLPIFNKRKEGIE